MKSSIIALTLSFALARPAVALGNGMSDSDIRAAIGDRTVVLRTTYGSIPLTYRSDGSVTGDGSGTGLGRFFAPKETGQWWVSESRMCQKFPTWYDGRTFCFTLQNAGAGKLKWTREDGYSGIAEIR
ncbi:MAG: hypothetical protein OXR62_15600 [Ahrensia sp.]|nr:hypothetical protein [Ahrensia sp.]